MGDSDHGKRQICPDDGRLGPGGRDVDAASAGEVKEERVRPGSFPKTVCRPAGWCGVGAMSDKPVDPKIKWTVTEGILHGSEPRGTWLISRRQYGDFILKIRLQVGYAWQ